MSARQVHLHRRRPSVTSATRTALYRHYDADNVLLYVGISSNPFARNRAHKGAEWADRAVRFTGEWFDSRAEALAAERRAVREENPEFNRHRYGAPGGPATPLPRPPDASVSTTIRLDPKLVAAVAARAERADVDFSHMVRRMLAYADQHMPEGWTPPARTSITSDGRVAR